jgi:hypothetical protein
LNFQTTTTTDGIVTVSGCVTHFGHELEPAKMRLICKQELMLLCEYLQEYGNRDYRAAKVME